MTDNNHPAAQAANTIPQAENNQEPEESSAPEHIQFHEAKGKVVADVRWVSGAEGHMISINFQDNTCLLFHMVPHLTLEPVYSAFQDGNEQIVQTWGELWSVGSRYTG